MSIEVRNLSYTYSPGLPDEHRALDNINFVVYDGEVCGIIGHTGSGKSTLVQQLDGLIKPDSGEIIISGADITRPNTIMRDVRRKVGLVFQYPEYQLFEETVEKDISFGPANLGLDQEAVRARVKKAVRLVGLDYEEIRSRSPFDLSGGQKRRVAIAGVIAMEPEVLILDEPTAGLDPGARRDIVEMIRTIHREEENIILFVSHNMEDVAELSDRVMVIDRGKLVTMGTPLEVFSQGPMLMKMGLDVPAPLRLLFRLKEAGIPARTDILTLEGAEKEIFRLLSERKKK